MSIVLAYWLPGKGMMKYTRNISVARSINNPTISNSDLFIEVIYNKVSRKEAKKRKVAKDLCNFCILT